MQTRKMPYQILLVDDDALFREEIRESFDEYTVVEASGGEEAIRLLKRPNQIDLVILDVMMPGLKGTEVLREIKKIAPHLHIIILTGYSTKDIAIEALKGDADDYLEKPLDIEKTKSMVAQLLRDKRPGGRDIEAEGIEGKIAQVKNFVDRNYHKRIYLKDAASAVCLSPKYLSRLFKQKAGMEFTDYKMNVRIAKAKEILLRNSLNIDEIAFQMGYKNTESFIRLFKKATRSTPTEYRKRKGKHAPRKRRKPVTKRRV